MRMMVSGLLLMACNGNGSGTSIVDNDEDGYFSDVDCADDNPLINPGAAELCDAVDNDCDTEIDEADAIEAQLWFPDNDGDGYGDPLGPIGGCEGPEGYINNPDDCDDDDFNINPGVDEICDNVDNDCDGIADEDSALDAREFYRDSDGDGYGNPFVSTRRCAAGGGYVEGEPLDPEQIDCDDGRPLVNPGATEICDEDELDEDCDFLVNDEDPSVV
ncbi:MAG: putative metal-binding motif-containing protein, partial [Myxococcota bacterium]